MDTADDVPPNRLPISQITDSRLVSELAAAKPAMPPPTTNTSVV